MLAASATSNVIMVRPSLCPICQAAVDPLSKSLPFCTARCQQIDLLRWSKGKYAIVEPLRPEHIDPELAEDMPPEWGCEE